MRQPHTSELNANRDRARNRSRGGCAWIAAWLQARRRARRQPPAPPPAPNAPVVTTGNYEWDVTTPGWADVWIEWTFAHGESPVANLEIWVSADGGDFELATTVPSTDLTAYFASACNAETNFDFKVRYQNGDTLGPFSNVMHVEVAIA